MKAILPMAGPGTRLRPFTYTQPKHLIKIAGKPFIEYILRTLLQAEINEMILVVGYRKDQIIDQLGDGAKLGFRINYAVQNQPKGIADAILSSEKLIEDEPFIVYLPDTIIPSGIKRYVKLFLELNTYALILTSKLPRSKLKSAGTVQTDKNGKVTKLEEKSPSPKSNLALAGVYFFGTPVIFDIIKRLAPSRRGELEITDAIQRLIDEGYPVQNQTIPKEYIDIGNSEGLLRANRYILSSVENVNEGKLEGGVNLKGDMRIGEGTIIRRNSKLHGPLYIGRKCQIGPSTSIGPYVSIGNNTTIRGGNISNMIIMNGSQLNIKGTISRSIIGENTKVIDKSGEGKELKRTLILGDHSSITI